MKLNSGTAPTMLCVGLGAAARISMEEMAYDYKRISMLSKRLISQITSQLTDVVLNGDQNSTYPGCVNMSFAYVEGESLLMACRDIALSSGRFHTHKATFWMNFFQDFLIFYIFKCMYFGFFRAKLRFKSYRSR